ncbi:hypothetical protein M3701_07225, partial [Corynebacterium mucifaciens]|nr:hypothetical protein [Corynebacterium mucifaciens]
ALLDTHHGVTRCDRVTQETGNKTFPQVREFFEEFKGCFGIFFWLRSKKECECTGPERIVLLI